MGDDNSFKVVRLIIWGPAGAEAFGARESNLDLRISLWRSQVRRPPSLYVDEGLQTGSLLS